MATTASMNLFWDSVGVLINDRCSIFIGRCNNTRPLLALPYNVNNHFNMVISTTKRAYYMEFVGRQFDTLSVKNI